MPCLLIWLPCLLIWESRVLSQQNKWWVCMTMSINVVFIYSAYHFAYHKIGRMCKMMNRKNRGPSESKIIWNYVYSVLYALSNAPLPVLNSLGWKQHFSLTLIKVKSGNGFSYFSSIGSGFDSSFHSGVFIFIYFAWSKLNLLLFSLNLSK